MQATWIRVFCTEVVCLLFVDFARGAYNITVTTGFRFGAGTNSVMNYRLQGTNGDSGTRVFPGQELGMFERYSVDTFYEPDDFGIIEAVTLGHNNFGVHANWDFEKVNIHDGLRGYDYEFVCNCWIPLDTIDNYKSFAITGRTMSPSETLIRWEASLCHLDPEPHVYQAIGEHVTTLMSDGLPQTCEPFFPTRRPFVASVMFIHRVLPSGSPRVNVIGRYIDCSPITGLWMYAMDDSGIPQPCAYYTGLNVGDFTTCRYQCNTGGLVSYIVIGNSNRRAMTMSDTAVICDIALV